MDWCITNIPLLLIILNVVSMQKCLTAVCKNRLKLCYITSTQILSVSGENLRNPAAVNEFHLIFPTKLFPHFLYNKHQFSTTGYYVRIITINAGQALHSMGPLTINQKMLVPRLSISTPKNLCTCISLIPQCARSAGKNKLIACGLQPKICTH